MSSYIKVIVKTASVVDEHIFLFKDDAQLKTFMEEGGFGGLHPDNIADNGKPANSDEKQDVIILGFVPFEVGTSTKH